MGDGRDVEGPAQGALFEIEVDEDDGCVRVVASGQVMNLGPECAVATKLADWLAERDFEA